MTKYIINVTQDHINRGVKFNPEYCPVALALKEYLPVTDVVVSTHTVMLRTRKKKLIFVTTKCTNISLPTDATIFIRNFDMGGSLRGKPEPFSFEVELD